MDEHFGYDHGSHYGVVGDGSRRPVLMDNNTPSLRKIALPWGLSGDQQLISADLSPFREGSGWNFQPGTGTMYALVGNQIVMKYWTHNAPLDANGLFLGRDDPGACGLWAYCEDETTRFYGAPAVTAKGILPVWTLYQTYNNLTGETINVGIITPSQTLGIRGTTTNNAANALSIGELVTATVIAGSAVALTTATGANITSISLTAGDWDVSAVADFTPAATTSITQLQAGLGTVTATLLTQPGGGGVGTDPLVSQTQAASVPGAGPMTLSLPPVRVTLAGTTTIFFVAKCAFTVSTLAAYGTIRARRIR